MAERMFEVQSGPGGEVILRIRPRRLRLMPQASRDHLKAAGREFLLALRAALDAALEQLGGEGEGRPRRRRVEVKEEKPSS